MHVASPDPMPYELATAPREISEDQLVEDGPRVRALIVQRLELVWARCEQRIRDDMDGTRPIDPRFLEIALRAEKDLALHYRLNKIPVPVEEEEDPSIQGVDRGALVLNFLEGVEARSGEGQAAAAAWGAGKSEPEVKDLGQDEAAA